VTDSWCVKQFIISDPFLSIGSTRLNKFLIEHKLNQNWSN